MAFTTVGPRPLRRSGGLRTVKCTVSDSTRRAFMKVAMPGVLVGRPIYGLAEDAVPTMSLYDLSASMDGQKVEMNKYRGKVVLVINVTPYCALLTPQCEELLSLYDKYSGKGFEVLAYPCDQFGQQEPSDYEDTCKIARERYGAKFSIFDEVNVNPPNVDNVYKFLKSTNPESHKPIEWNFAKFLVDKDGQAARRYKPGILPSMLEEDVARLLDGKPLPPRPKPHIKAA
ncbi:hypothetical protein NDN08_007072 [Rhodosorus marinus]|uniref:Glutathione peroxidase n=1 Tax=Rhodosorus marinus TaxID=101924 RepID=A0AAV8UJI8_9RHOD|nr:hypothetical protein NDN08_007072 [Rhodosorus marinus]